MYIPSRTLGQLLVASIALLVPIEAACLPASLPALSPTSQSSSLATATSATGASLITPLAMQLGKVVVASKSSSSSKATSSSVKATQSAAAGLGRPVFVTATAKSTAKATSTSSTAKSTGTATAVSGKGKRAVQPIANKYTAAGRAILKRAVEVSEAEMAELEADVQASALTVEFSKSTENDLVSKVQFGSSSKAETDLISDLKFAVSAAVDSIAHSLTFQKRSSGPTLAALQFGINRERHAERAQ